LTYSIADGMALGFIAYPLTKTFAGEAVHPVMILIAVLFLLRYVMLPG
jgi:AGZA family xanthine/uracil permease-like MFS transporter